MNAVNKINAVVWVMLLSALLIQPTLPAYAEDSHVTGTMVLSPTEEPGAQKGNLSVLASGAVEDSLKTCMARIPNLASDGQYLLAKQSCVGEEQMRTESRSAPKF